MNAMGLLARSACGIVFAVSALMMPALVRAESNCLPLSLPESDDYLFGGASSTLAVYSANLANIGGALPDYLDVFFFNQGVSQIGTFDLSSGDDANYATCLRCLSICLDYDDGSGECGKWLFQDQGILTVTDPPEDGIPSFVLQGLRWVESTLDPNTYESSPVPGGICYDSDLVPSPGLFDDGFEALPPLR